MKKRDKWLSALSQTILGRELIEETITKEELIYLLDYLDNIIASLPGSVYWKDQNGVYQGGNNYITEMAGFNSRSEILGKTDMDFAKIFNWSKKELDRTISVDMEIIKSGVPVTNHEEYPFRVSDGKNLTQLTNKVPLYDKRKKVIGVLGVSIDFTEHKKHQEDLEIGKEKAEKRALSSQENLERIIACLPGSVYWKDTQGVYLGCNDAMAHMIGLPKSEIIGKTDLDFADIFGSIKISEAFRKTDKEVIDSRAPVLNIEEPPFHFADGKIINQLSSRVPLLDGNNIVGVVGISIDITEQKKMEELIQAKKAAESANYLMTEFVSNMGHDLATPISDVGGIAQLLLNYVDEYPEFKEDFEILATRSEDCEKVRQHILNATSISNLEIKPEKFSICLVLLALEKELGPTIDSKNLKLIIHPLKPKKDDLIVTDRIKFHDILFDVISNAINFTEEGQVTISIIKEDDLFHIKVSDTGIGIPADKFDYIFQQYTKLSRSNKYGATFKGVGAGLYLARIRANILNATISVESEVGKGSMFTLSIPAMHSDRKDQY